jgi:hypothetical protein
MCAHITPMLRYAESALLSEGFFRDLAGGGLN